MSRKASAGTGELVEKSFIHYVPIIIVCILICGVPSAILNSAAGIYYPVMAEDFGVPVSQISLWRTFDYITGVIATPFAGLFLAKYNSKIIILSCAIVESLVFILFGMAPSVPVLWVGGAIAGVTNGVMLGVAISVLINRWFRVSVGLVIGVATAFTGFGGMLFTPIGQYIIDTAGWRASYIELGIFSLIVMTVGVLLFMANKPEDKGLLPYGTAKAAAKASISEEEAVEPLCVRPSVARKSLVLVLIIILFLFINTVANVNAYFATYINWYNAQADVVAGIMVGAFVTGAQLTAFNSFGNAVGKLGLGFMSDLSMKVTLVVLVACGIVGLVFMWQFPTTILPPIGSVLIGCFIPAVLVLGPQIVREVFGNGASFPVIYGYCSWALGLGGAIGSYVWGACYENLGGFDAVFGIACACLVAILILGFVVLGMKNKLPREHLTQKDIEEGKAGTL